MLLLLILPLVVVIIEEQKIWNVKQESIYSENPPKPPNITSEMPDLQKPNASQEGETTQNQKQVSCWRDMLNPPRRGEDHTILQALFSPDMVILFFATICGLGGSLTVVNNLDLHG
uniref:Nodulin-like domain-containing protein n=1 Tax=Lotus japonicus TaxID=34305 RepID=I3S0G0_LOTJA|nr:unknown [Lotus japonicus]